MRGLPDFEAMQGGAVWRFHNEGNRASFAEHPEIYGPQFGGYDPTEVARGVTQAGNPMFFVVADQRLYLFSREANRDAFAADPAAFPGAGERALAGTRARPVSVRVCRCRRIAPGDEARHDEAGRTPSPNFRTPPSGSVTRPPAAVTTAMAGGDIPFGGRGKPRIEIDRAFGETAELDR